MKTIKIHDIPMPEWEQKVCDLQNEYYGYPLSERYYIAYETDLNKPSSCLFNDLKWLSKHYGVTLHDENCDITDQSLNKGRDPYIAKVKDMIKRNIAYHDYDYLNENGMVDLTDNYGNKTSKTYKAYINSDNQLVPERTVTEREPDTLGASGKEHFQKDIDRGRLVLCRYIR